MFLVELWEVLSFVSTTIHFYSFITFVCGTRVIVFFLLLKHNIFSLPWLNVYFWGKLQGFVGVLPLFTILSFTRWHY